MPGRAPVIKLDGGTPEKLVSLIKYYAAKNSGEIRRCSVCAMLFDPVDRPFAVKSLGIAGFELIDVHLEDFVQPVADDVRGAGEIPCHVAEFLGEFFLIQRMTMGDMFFDHVDDL